MSLFQSRPAPPHLTSIQAEQLLAKACENESENAKRMRMGLEPISQPIPTTNNNTHSIVDVLANSHPTPNNSTSVSSLFPNMSAVTCEPSPSKIPKTEYKPEQLATLLQAAASQGSTTLTPVMTSSPSTVTPHPGGGPQQGLTVTPTSANFHSFNGTTLYKQSFGQANGNASFPPTATLLQNQSNVIQNGKIHLI